MSMKQLTLCDNPAVYFISYSQHANKVRPLGTFKVLENLHVEVDDVEVSALLRKGSNVQNIVILHENILTVSRHARPSLMGAKSVTKQAALCSLMNFGMVFVASPFTRKKGIFKSANAGSSSLRPLSMNPNCLAPDSR